MIYNKATGQPGVGEKVIQYPGAKEPGIVPPEKSKAGNKYRKDFKCCVGVCKCYDHNSNVVYEGVGSKYINF